MKQNKSRRKRGKARAKRQCVGKTAYAETTARQVVVAMTKKFGIKYRAYRCNFCYLPSGAVSWHVGHAQTLRRRLGR